MIAARSMTGFAFAVAAACCLALLPIIGEAVQIEANGLIQASSSHQRFGAYLGRESAASHAIEGRLDLSIREGRWHAVARPRLRGYTTRTDIDGYPQPRHASFNEIYASVDASDTWRLTAGKRYLAWGSGLLYSPSNRLFPDNGSANPRQEIPGKQMLVASGMLWDDWQLTALVADTYLERSPEIRRRDLFYLLRGETIATSLDDWSWGLVAGGGAGLQPYVGGHLQRGVGEAVTVGLEWSASRGYADAEPGWPSLEQNQRRWAADAALSLRYGLEDGGEVAAEFIYSGYRLSQAEAEIPWIGMLPPSAATQSRYAARHPLAEGRYLVLQSNFPRLFKTKQWTLFLRHLEDLDRGGRLSFAELGYLVSKRMTIHLGATVTNGSQSSSLVRSLQRAVYLAAELHF